MKDQYSIIRFIIDTLVAYLGAIILVLPIINVYFMRSVMRTTVQEVIKGNIDKKK